MFASPFMVKIENSNKHNVFVSVCLWPIYKQWIPPIPGCDGKCAQVSHSH